MTYINYLAIYNTAKYLNVDFKGYTLKELITGVEVEMEHGLVNPKTNVTDDDLVKTMKIALAHLNEYPNYYNNLYGLLKFEEHLKSKLK